MLKLPARLAGEAIANLFKKPATLDPEKTERQLQPGFRGRLSYRPELCNGCGACVKACPASAIRVINVGYREAPRFECTLDLGLCLLCGQCAEDCPHACLKLSSEPPPPVLSRHELKVTL